MISIKVDSVTNNTTSVVLLRREQGGVTEKGKFEFVEFSEAGFNVEIPHRSCASGHHLLTTLVVTPEEGEPISFESSSKVIESEALGDDRDYISLELLQYESETWERILEFFTQKQEKLDDLLAIVKGEK